MNNDVYNLIKELFPICRSITGNGVRETFQIIKKHISLKINEVPTGTKVFDWTVPKEWNIKDAYIKDSLGHKIVDFKKNNLHILNYSRPIKAKMTFEELKPHLFSLPDKPNTIPYHSSYYNENWGFCLADSELKKMKNGIYEVLIDSTLSNGSLTYGELYLKGEISDEILFSTYVCHPSMCNDNLTGPAIVTFLAKEIMKSKRRYSYRFLFIPETIGAITWLKFNQKKIHNIKAGLVATCLGDSGQMTYKRSRIGDSYIDKVSENVLLQSGEKYRVEDFVPKGSDERQFSSPGFNLAVGSLMRTPYGKFSEYHTSDDNLNFVSAKNLNNSLERYKEVFFIIENDRYYQSLNPKCEPMLGKRGLYSGIKGSKCTEMDEDAFRWILNFSDGKHSLLDISIKSGLRFSDIKRATDILEENHLLRKAVKTKRV